MRFIDLGRMSWQDAWARQEQAHADVALGSDECVFVVEHPHVITLGRQADVARRSLRVDEARLRELGYDLVETDRGGNVTYHGPGQLVAYPILKLADHRLSVGAYVRKLQDAVIDCLARCTIRAKLDPSAVGVWVDDHGVDAKICAVGVRVKRGITMHGLALNVETDLRRFDVIIPCGLEGRPVTSMRKILGVQCPEMSQVRWLLVRSLLETFEPSDRAIPVE
jgi:lipoyl(octanoyl) transferase